MGNVIIQSVDDLFGFMALTLTGEARWDEVDLDRLHVTIPVRVYGPTRDGRIDPPGAQLIQDLQRHAVKAFREIGDTTTGGRSTQLRVSVQENCDFWDIDATALIKEAILKMSGDQITAAIFFFLILGAGYFVFKKHQDTKLEIMKLQIASDEKKALYEHEEKMITGLSELREKSEEKNGIALQALEVSKESLAVAHDFAYKMIQNANLSGDDAQRPIRRFSKTLRKNETLSIGGEERLTKREALEAIGNIKKDDSLYYTHADETYGIAGLIFSGESQGLRVIFEGQESFAILERLDADIKSKILEIADESMEMKSVRNMPLQMDIYFKSSGIKYGVVIGVGPKRPKLNHYTLSQIPGGVPAADWIIPGTRAIS
ncbi:MAG: hypothetical protein AB7D27_01735 [Desulfomicrobium sp.]